MDTDQDPTELAGCAEADTMSAFAWTQEDELEDYPPTTLLERIGPRRVTTAALIAGVGACVAAAVTGFLVLQPHQSVNVTVIKPSVTTSVVTVAAPAPPRPTTQVWTAEAIPPASPDTQYINTLKADGWTITNADQATYKAHLICTAFQQGYNRAWIEQQLEKAPTATPAQVQEMVTVAMDTYPNCD